MGVIVAAIIKKHPRLRGEDLPLRRGPESRPETPPLTRGRLTSSEGNLVVAGNTPAYAGKTGAAIVRVGPLEKHPRLRGEDQDSPRQNEREGETPPLTRGRQSFAPKERDDFEKHPRLRGEDSNILWKEEP